MSSHSTKTPRGRIEIRVRYQECDPMGVAHHTAHPVWFEMGRTELLRTGSGLRYRDLEARGVFFAVFKMSVHYRRPACYDDLLELKGSFDLIISDIKMPDHSGYEVFSKEIPKSI